MRMPAPDPSFNFIDSFTLGLLASNSTRFKLRPSRGWPLFAISVPIQGAPCLDPHHPTNNLPPFGTPQRICVWRAYDRLVPPAAATLRAVAPPPTSLPPCSSP